MRLARTSRVSLPVTAICVALTTAQAVAQTPSGRLLRYDLKCPVCRQAFTAVACPDANTREGVDRDLFARSLGPQPEYYRIATCPKCGYSGYESDFTSSVVIPPDVRDKILKKPRLALPKGFTPDSDPLDLDAADRYELAIICYRWRQRSDEALAWLHLRASWVHRDEGSTLPPDPRLVRVMQFIERWRPIRDPKENQADAEMGLATRIAEAIETGRFNRYQKPYVTLALMMILRRHGENRLAEPLIHTMAESKDFTPVMQDAIRRMRDSMQRERKHQAAAAECFERAMMSNQITGKNRPPAYYLLGELNRRLGRDQEAIRWYDQALQSPEIDDQLKAWAGQQRAWAAIGTGE